MIHSQFTFFVCKPKFLFSLNGSCPFLVSSLSCLQSDFSNKTAPAVTLAGWQSQPFSTRLELVGQFQPVLAREQWWETQAVSPHGVVVVDRVWNRDTIIGIKAVNWALFHNPGQQTVGWLCISLFAQSSRLGRKLGTKCWLEGIGLAEVYRMDELSSLSPNLQEAKLHSFVEHLVTDHGYDLNMCRSTDVSQEREKQIMREKLNQCSSSLCQVTSRMH